VIYPEPKLSPFDVCKHCGVIQNLHFPGTDVCGHFEKADPSHTVREIPPSACECCGARSSDDSSTEILLRKIERRWLCSLCFDEAAKAAKLPKPNVQVGNHPMPPPGDPTPFTYIPPKLEKLSLEERLLEHAANWHMVRARLRTTTEAIQKDDHRRWIEIESFYNFCVQLSKGVTQ
jgi:hypothetical protein